MSDFPATSSTELGLFRGESIELEDSELFGKLIFPAIKFMKCFDSKSHLWVIEFKRIVKKKKSGSRSRIS